MHLYDIPLYFVLAGLVLYTVLAGADFGAGIWQLAARARPEGRPYRDHAFRAMAPVWEANHVWLLFAVTVSWTAYPRVFASVFSTLCAPLFLAAVGIIMRGAAYALRSGSPDRRAIDVLFAASSILTPFGLGAAVGGIASGRVPVGNAAGDLIDSWVNPTSIAVGTLAVAVSAYLAAVYLAADAARIHAPDLERYYRGRALATGVVAGAIAVAGLVVLHSDAHPLYRRLVAGDGLAALVASIVAGLATLALVWLRRYGLARLGAAAAVAAVIVGWALAQLPTVLPGLTVRQAAAPHDTLVALVVVVLAGIPLLLPSLALLFGLYLRGRFDPGGERPAPPPKHTAGQVLRASRPGLLGRSAVALLIATVGFLNVADTGWANAVGVVCVLAFMLVGFVAIVSSDLFAEPADNR
ncbi:MAG: cytochrome bd ubiquinol oxidase subunit [Thermoleophilales bacterium]|nr:cytochrome bd ubiquinol oxidase subunit [Thermoleophilales bacterium]